MWSERFTEEGREKALSRISFLVVLVPTTPFALSATERVAVIDDERVLVVRFTSLLFAASFPFASRSGNGLGDEGNRGFKRTA
jgi:hypothetical protein